MSSGRKTNPNSKKSVAQNGQTQKPKKTAKAKNNSSAPSRKNLPLGSAKSFVQQGPRITANEKGCVIEHCEPLGAIPQNGSGFLMHLVKSINPGISETFRWLAPQALCWEKYFFEYLQFEYVSRCSATNNGAILMAIDHDPADATPPSEDIMMNYNGAVDDNIWVSKLICALKTDRVKRFIRDGPLGANLDVKTYDAGNFYAATSGTGTATVAAGKVYVRYKVHFFIPQLPPNLPLGSNSFSGAVSMTPANPLGTAPTESPLGSGISIGTNSRVTFDRVGTYLSTLAAAGTGITSMDIPTLVSGAATVTDEFGAIASGSGSGLVKTLINVTQPGTVLQYLLTGTTVTGSHLDIASGSGLS